ncbi:MAG: hypothetical protein ACLFN8_00895 [Candidatus Woesearchaeota archaeon]
MKATTNTYGAPEYTLYNRLQLSAAATEEAIQILLKQLKSDGIVVEPLGQEILKITKEKRERWRSFSFVPLKKINS